MATKLALATARVAALELQLVEDRQHLMAANKLLAEENADLRLNLKAASDMILKLGGVKNTETPASNLVQIAPELHVKSFGWLLNYVGFTAQVSEEFMANWTIYTNAEKNWVALVPKVSNRETNRFCSEFGKKRASRNITGNIYKNTGVWVNIPVK
jgi:hypothetical protein